MPKSGGDISKQIEDLLKNDLKVFSIWKNLTPIGRRDFVGWVGSAKKLETQQKRLNRVRDVLLSGKRRPCCYALVPMNLYKALANDDRAKAGWKDLTADEKRDWADWVESAEDAETRGVRIQQVCAKLAERPQKMRG